MLSSVSFGKNDTANHILGAILDSSLIADVLSTSRLRDLECIRGVQFLYDGQGNYMEEVNKWQLKRALATPSAATRETRSHALKRVLSWFEERDLHWRDCTELAHMNMMRLTFRGAQSPLVEKGTWNQWMDHWFQFLVWCQREGYVDHIGFDRADLRERGVSKGSMRALSGNDFRVFFQGCQSQRMRAGVKSIAGTGIRVSELATLKMSDVPDPKSVANQGRMYMEQEIVGKGRKKRVILWPLSAVKTILHYIQGERAMAVANLKKRVQSGQVRLESTYLCKINDQTTGLVSLVEASDAPLWLAENGDVLAYGRWGKGFAETSEKVSRLAKASGMNTVYCSPHYLRHTYAIVMLGMLIKAQVRQEIIDQQLGFQLGRKYFLDPLREVSQRLGHVSIETTMVYLDHIAEHRAIIDMAVTDLQKIYFDA